MNTLENAVFNEIQNNIDGYTKDEAAYWVENDAICSYGAVNGLIYYTDTTAFFDKHEDEILNLAQEFEFTADPIELGMTGFKNIMAWFAFEALKDTVFENNIERFDFESEAANA